MIIDQLCLHGQFAVSILGGALHSQPCSLPLVPLSPPQTLVSTFSTSPSDFGHACGKGLLFSSQTKPRMLRGEVTCPRSGRVELEFELGLLDSKADGFKSKHRKAVENSLELPSWIMGSICNPEPLPLGILSLGHLFTVAEFTTGSVGLMLPSPLTSWGGFFGGAQGYHAKKAPRTPPPTPGLCTERGSISMHVG